MLREVRLTIQYDSVDFLQPAGEAEGVGDLGQADLLGEGHRGRYACFYIVGVVYPVKRAGLGECDNHSMLIGAIR